MEGDSGGAGRSRGASSLGDVGIASVLKSYNEDLSKDSIIKATADAFVAVGLSPLHVDCKAVVPRPGLAENRGYIMYQGPNMGGLSNVSSSKLQELVAYQQKPSACFALSAREDCRTAASLSRRGPCCFRNI